MKLWTSGLHKTLAVMMSAFLLAVSGCAKQPAANPSASPEPELSASPTAEATEVPRETPKAEENSRAEEILAGMSLDEKKYRR